MSMTRTNVYADPEDLALIKAAAARRGVPEAEILREGIHLAALGSRRWSESLVPPEQTVDLGGPVSADDVRAATAAAAREKSDGRAEQCGDPGPQQRAS